MHPHWDRRPYRRQLGVADHIELHPRAQCSESLKQVQATLPQQIAADKKEANRTASFTGVRRKEADVHTGRDDADLLAGYAVVLAQRLRRPPAPCDEAGGGNERS